MGFKRIATGVATGGLSEVDRATGNNGRNMLFGDRAGQAAEAARLAEMFKAQQEKARADLMAVLAERPEYKSILGNPEFSQDREFAYGDGSTKGFLMQRDREAQNLRDALQSQTQSQGGQVANAYSQLAMGGGLSGGARERIAAGGMQSGLLARQQLRGQNAKNLLDLGINEEGQRMQARGAVQGALQQDATNSNNYAQEAWKTRANTIAGLSQAESQQTAALAGRAQDKGACCFIFLEARYGTGAMDAVVRRYRDEHVTTQNARGYYKLSEILVPLMRQSRIAKLMVRALMTDPLVSYAKWHYRRRGIGFIFKPVKDFWMKAFNFFGSQTQFIRENGEII